MWYLRVVEELGKHGVEVSQYDKATFMFRVKGKLQGIIIIHVDDFLWAGSEIFTDRVMNPIKQSFRISKEEMSAFKYVGVNLEQKDELISLQQYQYIDSLQSIKADQSLSSDGNRLLSDSEKRSYRALVGQLQWSVTMSRPDMAYSSCDLGTTQSMPTLGDLKKGNKYLRDMKGDQVCLKFSKLDVSTMSIVVYADASYANLVDGGSQGGHIIFLSDAYDRCVPIAWSSKRLKRVARSTLSAETQAAVEALDAAYLLRKFIAELLSYDPQVTLFTDNKSLFDATSTTNLVSDKRLRVDLAALREMSDRNEVKFRWIETKKQLADVMTKKGPSKQNLLQVLQHCCLA